MKRIRISLNMMAGIAVASMFSSCVSEGNDPGIEYSPNMYVSEAYEAYKQEGEMKYNAEFGGMTMRPPVNGTIARGQLDYYQYPEGYEESVSWTNPLAPNAENLEKGQVLYQRNCAHCHGANGKNDGSVVKNSEYPSPPWAGYDADYIRQLPDGKIFHTITYGKGLMGPHAHLLSPNERWMVTHHVRRLSLGDAFIMRDAPAAPVNADSTAADTTAVPESATVNDEG